MSDIIGNNPDQVPTNGDLGPLAFAMFAGSLAGLTVFKVPGAYHYSIPDDVSSILVFVTGAGGAGGSQGMGGGAGGTAIKFIKRGEMSTTAFVSVGRSPSPPAGTGNGGDGERSFFRYSKQTVSAEGGNGGVNGSSTENPAGGGEATGGDINVRGGAGGTHRGSYGGLGFWGGPNLYTTAQIPDASGSGTGAGGRGGPGGIEAYAGDHGSVIIFEYR